MPMGTDWTCTAVHGLQEEGDFVYIWRHACTLGIVSAGGRSGQL